VSKSFEARGAMLFKYYSKVIQTLSPDSLRAPAILQFSFLTLTPPATDLPPQALPPGLPPQALLPGLLRRSPWGVSSPACFRFITSPEHWGHHCLFSLLFLCCWCFS